MGEPSRYRQKRRTPISATEFQAITGIIEAKSSGFRLDQVTQTSLVAILYYGGLRIAEVVGDSGRRWKVLTERGQSLKNSADGLPRGWMETEGLWEYKRRGELRGIVKEDIELDGNILYVISDLLT